MTTDLTLDEMILQYSENPFIDEKRCAAPAVEDGQQKRKILSRLLFIARNLFNGSQEAAEESTYKRRYEIILK